MNHPKILAVLAVCLMCTLSAPAADSPAAPATAPPEPEGMKVMFNGKDLAGWQGDTKLWTVKDGAIRGETTKENPAKGNTFLLYTAEGDKPVDFKDFEFRLTFRVGPANNSGVQYRSVHLPFKETDANKWVVSGYQCEIVDNGGACAFLYHEKGRGGLVRVGEKVVIEEDGKPQVVGTLGDKGAATRAYKKGEWNQLVIRAEGNHVRHWLNGVQTIDLVDKDEQPNPGKDNKPGNPLATRRMNGIIALQLHAGAPMWVEYKDLRVKALP